MDEMDIIDFDRDQGEIAPHDDIENLQLYLDFVPENDIPWNQYYLGLSIFSGLLLVAAEGGLIPFSWITTIAWASFVVVLFGVSAVMHTYHNRRMRLGREGPPPRYEYERRDQR